MREIVWACGLKEREITLVIFREPSRPPPTVPAILLAEVELRQRNKKSFSSLLNMCSSGRCGLTRLRLMWPKLASK